MGSLFDKKESLPARRPVDRGDPVEFVGKEMREWVMPELLKIRSDFEESDLDWLSQRLSYDARATASVLRRDQARPEILVELLKRAVAEVCWATQEERWVAGQRDGLPYSSFTLEGMACARCPLCNEQFPPKYVRYMPCARCGQATMRRLEREGQSWLWGALKEKMGDSFRDGDRQHWLRAWSGDSQDRLALVEAGQVFAGQLTQEETLALLLEAGFPKLMEGEVAERVAKFYPKLAKRFNELFPRCKRCKKRETQRGMKTGSICWGCWSN